jgi:hypothetical protein
MINVRDMVKAYLLDNGYDGLVNRGNGCDCEIRDLIPCELDCSECLPAHKHFDPRPGNSRCWHMWTQKEPPISEHWEEDY